MNFGLELGVLVTEEIVTLRNVKVETGELRGVGGVTPVDATVPATAVALAVASAHEDDGFVVELELPEPMLVTLKLELSAKFGEVLAVYVFWGVEDLLVTLPEALTAVLKQLLVAFVAFVAPVRSPGAFTVSASFERFPFGEFVFDATAFGCDAIPEVFEVLGNIILVVPGIVDFVRVLSICSGAPNEVFVMHAASHDSAIVRKFVGSAKAGTFGFANFFGFKEGLVVEAYGHFRFSVGTLV